MATLVGCEMPWNFDAEGFRPPKNAGADVSGCSYVRRKCPILVFLCGCAVDDVGGRCTLRRLPAHCAHDRGGRRTQTMAARRIRAAPRWSVRASIPTGNVVRSKTVGRQTCQQFDGCQSSTTRHCLDAEGLSGKGRCVRNTSRLSSACIELRPCLPDSSFRSTSAHIKECAF